MTTPRQQPDRQDRETARLLSDALPPPALRAEFAKQLGESLQAEFAAKPGLDLQVVARNGRVSLATGVVRSNDSPNQDSLIQDQSPHRQPLFRRPFSRQVGVALVTAASLLAAVGLLSSRPNYSWAAMVEAMGDQPWVHAETLRDGVVRVRRWVASGGSVDASQADGQVVYRRSIRGGFTKFSFSRGEERIVQQRQVTPVADGKQPTWSRLLPSLLDDPTGAEDHEARVVEESWRRVRTAEGRRLVELTVELEIDGKRVLWVLQVDPETHLPVSATPAEGVMGDGEETIRFSFPEQGPDSIHALGVSEQVQTVTLDATAELLPAENEKVSTKQVSRPPLGDPLAGPALTARIDELLSQHWQEESVTPADQASDVEFMRRAYLDLVGRIPTVGEARIFLEDADGEKRTQLVDELLASRDHATHFAAVWRRWLIPPSVDLAPYGGPDRLDRWLADRFQDNLPYDQLARKLLLAEGRISQSGPLLFYAALKLNPEEIAQQASRTFLGMQLDCAECHDHPFDDRITQEDFWGFAAMFAQISRPRGKMNVTSEVLRVQDNRMGEVTLPDSDTVVAPRLPLSERPIATGEDAPFLRRQFVDWLVDPHNERFGQAVVNRVWAHLFGRGLVEPIDDIRADNPPFVPELLEMLALDFARSGYDLRRLVKRIALTGAYQKTSQSETSGARPAEVFARMNVKSFTAEQLHDCIAVATRSAATAGRLPGDGGGGLVRSGDFSREQFIRLFEAPGGKAVDYHAGIPQALTMMHGGLIHSATDLGTSGLLRSLSAPFFTDEQRIETLFLATLSRQPTADELTLMSPHVATAADDNQRQERLGDILWALLNTAEFTLNH